MIKISYLNPPTVTGVNYYRCLQPLLYLQKFYSDKIKLLPANDKNLMDVVRASDIYFHPSPGGMLMRRFVEIVKDAMPRVKLVFDYDDVPHKYITPEYPSYREFGVKETSIHFGKLIDKNGEVIDFTRGWKNHAFIDGRPFNTETNIKNREDDCFIRAKADRITASTPYLAHLILSEFDRSVSVLPNFVEPMLCAPRLDRNKKADEVRILWQIGHSHLVDLVDLLPAIIDLINEKKNVTFFLMSQYNDMLVDIVKRVKVDKRRLVTFPSTGITDGYYNVLSSLDIDIGLMHLKLDDEYNKGKSPLKFLEMTACGAVSLAPNTLYGKYIKNEETGLIYANKNEFNHLIRDLVSDKAKRERLHANALESIKEFSPQRVVPQYLEFFENVMVGK